MVCAPAGAAKMQEAAGATPAQIWVRMFSPPFGVFFDRGAVCVLTRYLTSVAPVIGDRLRRSQSVPRLRDAGELSFWLARARAARRCDHRGGHGIGYERNERVDPPDLRHEVRLARRVAEDAHLEVGSERRE